MKFSHRWIAPAILACVFSQSASAVQFTVEDISNRIITCEGPLVQNFKPGTCISIPDATLAITATLDVGEDVSALNELDYVILHGGNAYHFESDTTSEASDRWRQMAAVPPYASTLSFKRASSQRLPFETQAVWRMVPMGQYYKQKGAQLFVGARENANAVFHPARVKMVHEVK